MTKVHPNATEEAIAEGGVSSSSSCDRNESTTLTVWKKSLLFNCNGFTVFDPKGNLLFRVDNYASDLKGRLLLMDASGHPLLTLRRKVGRRSSPLSLSLSLSILISMRRRSFTR